MTKEGIELAKKMMSLFFAARALVTRNDFWDYIECRPGEYDDLKEAVEAIDWRFGNGD